MFTIAVLPVRDIDSLTLLARNDEWLRLRDHLKRTRQGSLLAVIAVDKTSEVTKITLPVEQAHSMLRAAGISY